MIMEFIGDGSKAAPSELKYSSFQFLTCLGLRDSKMSQEEINDSYIQIVRLLRRMVLDCNLIHADFSEYNLLYLDKTVWVIDVSQSVEKDHPFSFEFLKRDIFNINNYYKKLGLNTFKFKSFFNVVTDPDMKPEEFEEEIENMKDEAVESPDSEQDVQDFLLFEIPKTLSIYDDIDEINEKLNIIKSNLDTRIFGRFLGADERLMNGVVFADEDDETEQDLDGESIDSEELMIQEQARKEKLKELPPKPTNRTDPFEGLDKAERQKKVKEENREKRKTKIPKKVKKAIIKKTSRKGN